MRKIILSLSTIASLLIAGTTYAGSILFVSDDSGSNSSLNISTVLSGDGHTVTNVLGDFATGNSALQGSLSSYDLVVWSASGNSFGNTHSTAPIANLTSYVNGGGNVFVTGYDSVASPGDANLYNFLGASSSSDLPGTNVGALSLVGNSLTTGLIDITGVAPTGAWGDRDALHGLGGDTIGLDPAGAGGFQWTLRSLGLGQIAYISAGRHGNYSSDDTAWLNTSAGAAGAYNAGLRNFAYNSTVPEPATVFLMGLALAGLGMRKKQAA